MNLQELRWVAVKPEKCESISYFGANLFGYLGHRMEHADQGCIGEIQELFLSGDRLDSALALDCQSKAVWNPALAICYSKCDLAQPNTLREQPFRPRPCAPRPARLLRDKSMIWYISMGLCEEILTHSLVLGAVCTSPSFIFRTSSYNAHTRVCGTESLVALCNLLQQFLLICITCAT